MGRWFSRALVRDGSLAGGASLVTNAGTYVFYAVAAHRLGPDRGGLFLALVSATLLVSINANIVGVAATPELARLTAAGQSHAVYALFLRLIRGWTMASGLVAITLFVAFPIVSGLFRVNDPFLLASAGAALCANALLLLLRAFQQGIGRFDAFAWSNIAETIGKVCAAAMLFALPTLRVGLAGFALALVIPAIVTVIMTKRLIAAVPVEDTPIALGSSFFSLVTALGALTVMTFIDGIIARRVLTPFDAGLYNAAALAGRALMTVLAFMPTVILAKVVPSEADDSGSMGPIYVIAGLACAVAIVVFFFFPTMILNAIGGKAYVSGSSLVSLYGIAASALAMTSVVAAHRIGRGVLGLGRVLIVVAAIEIVAMLVAHRTPLMLVSVVVAGHITALCAACFTRFWPVGRRDWRWK